MRNELRELGGRYNGTLKCWSFPLTLINQVTILVNNRRTETVQKRTKTAVEPTTFIQEIEAPFTPNINRLPKQRIENATYEEKIRLQQEMLRRDCQELQQQWACS